MNSLKSVLFIAYEFPPAGGIEVQRIVKFIKYIRNHNINPIVLTTSHGLSRFMDYDLLDIEHIRDTDIIRLGGNKTYRYHKFKNKKNHPHHPYIYYLGLRYIWFLDIYSSWFLETKNNLKYILEKNNIKCVFTTSPPASTNLFGNYVARNFDIPWVMDIRDSMVNTADSKKTLISNFTKKINKYYERRFCFHANRIITVSQPIIDNMADRIGELIYEKSHVIMNGYDASDFNNKTSLSRNHNKLLITYTGSFLGSRTPEYFLHALKKLILTEAVSANDIKLRFVGKIPNNKMETLKEISELIHIDAVESVSHHEAIAYQQTSDLLLLILAPVDGRYASEVISGKIFEYMAAQRPVLGLIPDGPLQSIFRTTKIGFTAKSNDVDNIADTFNAIYKQWQDGGIHYQPDNNEIQKYTREKQTEQLASIIHDLT